MSGQEDEARRLQALQARAFEEAQEKFALEAKKYVREWKASFAQWSEYARQATDLIGIGGLGSLLSGVINSIKSLITSAEELAGLVDKNAELAKSTITTRLTQDPSFLTFATNLGLQGQTANQAALKIQEIMNDTTAAFLEDKIPNPATTSGLPVAAITHAQAAQKAITAYLLGTAEAPGPLALRYPNLSQQDLTKLAEKATFTLTGLPAEGASIARMAGMPITTGLAATLANLQRFAGTPATLTASQIPAFTTDVSAVTNLVRTLTTQTRQSAVTLAPQQSSLAGVFTVPDITGQLPFGVLASPDQVNAPGATPPAPATIVAAAR